MYCRLCGLMKVGLRRTGDIEIKLSAKACCRRRGSGGAAVLARTRRWRRLRRCVARRRWVSGGYVRATVPVHLVRGFGLCAPEHQSAS
jgi:hypothetical protein